ncbi:hypothetical protein [Paenibacillus protaetiae]|uniref:Uncharacterized protein n=1 Tax=Paenibacillus protaetiae TaxID=2509456 RepID=A0A4P6ESR5_9BACL|nr:hypothetical protein [Paenibacillus protaetiae]QAY65944.1 hypothetical protein ET464_05635 [Paenibacillus protaetiae]
MEQIIRHYNGVEAPNGTIVHGLAAYETWIDAFRGGQIEPNGNAYNAAVIQEARMYASLFLSELAESWESGQDADADADSEVRAICREAAALYGETAEQLKTLTTRFPFPAGGDPHAAAEANAAIAALQQAYKLETEAFALLEQLHRILS